MLRIKFSKLDEQMELSKSFLEKYPELKRAILEAVGKVEWDEVMAQIKEHLHDDHGHVAGMQEMRIGDGLGYVAVSPKADTLAEGVKYRGEDVSARRFTTWLEKGHATRRWHTVGRRYSDHNDMYYIPGKLFYSWARTRLKYGQSVLNAAKKARSEFVRQVKEGRM